jgi:5'-3' exonuclease
MTHALIDADILVYRVGFTTQDVELELAKWRMNELIERILADTKATSYKLYLTTSGDKEAFRHKIYPEYKQNRKADKPLHYQSLREFLVEDCNAEMVSVIEADDILGIEQCKDVANTIICTIDKDLDMIPGWHYNFVKELRYYIHEDQGIRNFYKQLLMGDTADNVKGIQGIGPAKADKILAGSENEQEYFERTREAYGNDEAMLQNGEVLWILRTPYPNGRWSLTSYGSLLVQQDVSKLELDSKQKQLGMESIGEDQLKVGFQPSGQDQRDITEEMGGSLNLT